MGRRHEPLERRLAKAKGDGRTPSKLPVQRARVTVTRNSGPIPPAPRGLGPRGKVEWRKVWTAGRAWLKDDQDYHWVTMIAQAYSDIETFRKRVEEDGLVVTGYAGQVVAHPLIAEIRKCEQTIQKCLSILGFSPSDRARLGIQEAKVQNALLDLKERAERQRS